MNIELSGKLVEVQDEQTGQGRNGVWKKQSFVIETQDQYPKKICITAWGERTDSLKSLQAGELVKAHVDIESREYNGRWYTDVKAWRIEKEQPTVVPGAGAPSHSIDDIPPESDEMGDLPF